MSTTHPQAAPPEAILETPLVVAPRRRALSRVRTESLRVPLLCLCYMALLIGAAVGVDRGIAGRIFAAPHDFVPAYRSFPEYAFGVKLQQFSGVRDKVDTLVIGNSRTLFGVDAARLDRGLAAQGVRTRAYNLALPSVDVRFWPTFFERYDRGPAPKHLLLGLLPRDLDARNALGARLAGAFTASAGFQNRGMTPISRWSEERLADLFLLRGRASDLRLVHPSDVLAGRKLDLHPIHLADRLGRGLLPATNVLSPATLQARAARLAVRHGATPFVLGAAQKRALIDLNAWVRGRGGCLTLYTTPVLYDEEQWGTLEMRAGFDAAIRRLAPQLPGVSFVDIGAAQRGAFGVRDFGDGDHLDARGARRFSGRLATALAPALRRPSCP